MPPSVPAGHNLVKCLVDGEGMAESSSADGQ